MSAKYKTKRKAGRITSSCGMCKPHKHGWSDKVKAKERGRRDASDKEIREHGG